MTKVTVNVSAPKQENIRVKAGDFLMSEKGNDLLQLCQVSPGQYKLMTVEGGNRWTEKDVSGYRPGVGVLLHELDAMYGRVGDLRLVKAVTIEVQV